MKQHMNWEALNRKHKKEAYLDARDEWVIEQIKDLVWTVTRKFNERADGEHDYGYYSQDEVRELIRKLI